jgi:chromosomal replication initiation ATPase DnaA
MSFMPRPIEVISTDALAPDDTQTAPAALVAFLERSKAQAEGGLTVPLEPILDELRASIARMKAKRAGQGQA